MTAYRPPFLAVEGLNVTESGPIVPAAALGCPSIERGRWQVPVIVVGDESYR